jgi:hypothetical protein
MFLAREFGRNGLIANLVPRRNVPSHRDNVYCQLQEFDRDNRGATFETDSALIRDSSALLQRDISAIRGGLDCDFDRMLSGLEKMAGKLKLAGKKCQSDQRAFVEMLIEWVGLKSISSARSVIRCSERWFNSSTRFFCVSV